MTGLKIHRAESPKAKRLEESAFPNVRASGIVVLLVDNPLTTGNRVNCEFRRGRVLLSPRATDIIGADFVNDRRYRISPLPACSFGDSHATGDECATSMPRARDTITLMMSELLFGVTVKATV